jgi:hypothetical protein
MLQKLGCRITLKAMPNTFHVTYGGWYQRTTLHLSEIYEFLVNGKSKLALDQEQLDENRRALGLKEVFRELGYLECIRAETTHGVTIKYFEDGLYVLETENENPKKAKGILESYMLEKLTPAVNYLFSLGAPTPKILANIEVAHPTVVSFHDEDYGHYAIPEEYGETYSKIVSGPLAVYKNPEYIFIISKPGNSISLENTVYMQIFFREFKDQLEKYLNIHRKIWEEIAEIREKRFMAANEIPELRSHLASYQKTVDLISNRINQMGSYIKTRQNISKKFQLDIYLLDLFQYRFEVLVDTLEYIKEIWKMTGNYLNSAIAAISEIQNLGTTRSIQSLTLITTVSVMAGLISHIARESLPTATVQGIIYLAALLTLSVVLNSAITFISSTKKHRISFPNTEKNI